MKMKKLATMLLTLSMVAVLTACGGDTKPQVEDQPQVEQPATDEVTDDATDGVVEEPVEDLAPEEATTEEGANAEEVVSADGAAALLNDVWTTYEEADLFPAGGGDAENNVMDAAGKVDITNAESLDAILAVPADAVSYIDDAASLMHMMNANTFTGGAFHVTDSANTDAFIDAMKDSLANRQWICGAPEKMLIVKVDDSNVIMAFGETSIMDTFKEKVASVYTAAEVVVEENITL